ncbi:unnamed protein product [Caenorhabditis sp. 36 PRJEB53466]|nr:unnamed protein product [Caenorhabditis sp. 36 PRJEB53466]
MAATCEPDTSYTSSPDFLALTCHILTGISVPIHIFGGWMIVTQSPSTMKTMKWSMLNSHFWSSFLDLALTFLFIPYVFAPTLSGYPLGVISITGLSTMLQTQSCCTLFGCPPTTFKIDAVPFKLPGPKMMADNTILTFPRL